MSKLYYAEEGNVVTTLCEELTDYRRARKVLSLPSTPSPGQLYVLARAYPGAGVPLRVALNERELLPIHASGLPIYRCYEAEAPRELLQPGENVFEFWTDASGHEGLVADHRGRPRKPVEPGEHRRRPKLAECEDGLPQREPRRVHRAPSSGRWPGPAFARDDLGGPGPSAAGSSPGAPASRRAGERADLRPGSRSLHMGLYQLGISPFRDGRAVRPLGSRNLLAWGASQQGQDGRPPIVMCVHYAVTLAMACLAAGIPARCAVFAEDLNGVNGHFTPEVWFPEYGKWVMVDPTVDAVLFRDDVAMSVSEIQAVGGDLRPFVQYGAGTAFQRRTPFIAEWIRTIFETGIYFRHRSLWLRMDFLSHPELTPSGHGATAYCETSLVWEMADLDAGYGMFAYFAEPAYFEAAPRLTFQSWGFGYPECAQSSRVEGRWDK